MEKIVDRAQLSEAATRGVNKVFLEISQNSQENTCARVFFNKVAGLIPVLFKEQLWTTASIVLYQTTQK